jgi:hypothetical protein
MAAEPPAINDNAANAAMAATIHGPAKALFSGVFNRFTSA